MRPLFASRFVWSTMFVLSIVVGLPMTASPARAQESSLCASALQAAAEQYRDGAFDETVRLASACLNQSPVAPGDARTAYRLLALAYLKQDDLPSARKAAVNILGVDPDYAPDPVDDPPDYVSLITVVRQDLQEDGLDAGAAGAAARRNDPPPFFRRTSTWVTLTTTVLAGGVVSVVLLNRESDDASPPSTPSGPGPLPPPPGVPPN
jgi:hypothetical protein